eukprot:862689-Pleurochrysis_carterae.AAC.1
MSFLALAPKARSTTYSTVCDEHRRASPAPGSGLSRARRRRLLRALVVADEAPRHASIADCDDEPGRRSTAIIINYWQKTR